MQKEILAKEHQKTLWFLLKWLTISLVSGIIGATVVELFRRAFERINIITESIDIIVLLIPSIGGIIVGSIIWIYGEELTIEDMVLYCDEVNGKKGYSSLIQIFLKGIITLITLTMMGSAGLAGPVSRFSSGINNIIWKIFNKIGFEEEDRRLFSICGFAAGMATVFHCSIGGGFFAVEILKRSSMRYLDLFPAVMSSVIAYLFAREMGFKSFYSFYTKKFEFDMETLTHLIILGIITGIVGLVVITLYASIKKHLIKIFPTPFKRIIIASFIVGIIGSVVGTAVLGTGKKEMLLLMEGKLFSLNINVGRESILMILLFLLIFKILAHIFTVGGGMGGGFTGPTVMIGILVGVIYTQVVGIAPNSSYFIVFIASAVAGMLSSVMNIPFSSIIIITEIFGKDYGVIAAMTSIISFQIARHTTIMEIEQIYSQKKKLKYG